ncbi:LmeA family phospholipid-binding protein [Nocardia goodfellowii]
MNTAQPPARVSRRTLTIALAVVVALLAALLIGGEAYARHRVANCVSTQFEQEMGSKIDVGFGVKPLLITYLDGKVGRVTVDSDDTKFGPAVGMVVHARFDDVEMIDSGKGGGTIGSSSADVDWSNEGIRETLAGLVTSVSSSKASGLLTLKVLGGLAELEVKPVVTNGVVEVETQSAALLGLGLPTDLVQGIVDVISKSLQSYPFDMKPTEISVTDDGIAVRLIGGRSELPASQGNSEINC